MKKLRLTIFIVIGTVLIIFITAFYIKSQSTITIAFSAGITGPLSELGVEARNAFILKIDEINDDGGINGKRIEYVILDDGNDPEKLKKNIAYCKDNNISFIVGPLISGLASTIRELSSDPDILFLSPSVASNTLNDIDDSFLRIAPSTRAQSQYLIDYFKTYDTAPSITLVYDLRNAQYVTEFSEHFFGSYNGDVSNIVTIGTDEGSTAEEAVEIYKNNPTDVFLMLTPAVETGKMAQLLALNELTPERISVSWSMTSDLPSIGGSAVEGIKFIYVDYAIEPNQDKDFNAVYKDKYSYSPPFISALTYQATDMLAAALQASDSLKTEDVKATLLDIEYTSLGDNIKLNPYGDRDMPFTLYILEDQTYSKYKQ